MRQRLISAAVLVPVVVIVFLLGAPWLTFGIAILSGFAAYETALLVRRAGLPSSLWMPVIAAPAAVLALAWVVGPERLPTIISCVAESAPSTKSNHPLIQSRSIKSMLI